MKIAGIVPRGGVMKLKIALAANALAVLLYLWVLFHMNPYASEERFILPILGLWVSIMSILLCIYKLSSYRLVIFRVRK